MIVEITRDVILNDVTYKKGAQIELTDGLVFDDVYMRSMDPVVDEVEAEAEVETPKKKSK